jgi:branched-chain amino acid transport system substrate-binding protein
MNDTRATVRIDRDRQRRPRARVLGIAVTSCAALVLTACSGGSSGGARASSSPSVGPTVAAPTGAPIKIGVFVASTNSSAIQGATVAPAWADYINTQLGGINGHPVQVIVEDDQDNPVTAQSEEFKLVHDDGVVALIPSEDLTLPSYQTDALAHHVPVISGTANNSAWFVNPGLFETPTDFLSGLTDQVLVAKKFGHATKFADAYCAEDPACSQANNPLEQAATRVGIGFTSLSVSSSATDYTAQCLKLQQEHVDYVQLNIDSDTGARLAESCQAQGYNPTYGATAQSVGPPFLKVPNLKLFGPALAFPSSGSGPGVETFTTAMMRFAKGTDWRDGSASFTWTALEVLHHALDGITGPVTRAAITNSLNKFKGVTLGGILPNPLTYTAGKPVAFGGHPCAFVIGIANGKVTAPAGMTTVCAHKP